MRPVSLVAISASNIVSALSIRQGFRYEVTRAKCNMPHYTDLSIRDPVVQWPVHGVTLQFNTM